MDTLDLARLQFIGTTGLHWLFVMLSLGLAPLVAIMHTWCVLCRDPGKRSSLERMTRFWGQIYVINYAVGIVTGLVMEFQLGLSWSGLSTFAGNVIGAPLALETLIAFFAESTFLGMWIFGWGRLRPWIHATLIWLVTLTAYASAYWIMVVNGFMQGPVGAEVRDGVSYLTDFGALLTNPHTVLAVEHISAAALLGGGVFIAGASAYHLLKHTAEREFFQRSLRLGVVVAAVSCLPTGLIGSMQFPLMEKTQPMKMAVIAHLPTDALQAQMVADHGPGDYVPPYWAEIGEETMLYTGYVLGIVALPAFLVVMRDVLTRHRLITIAVIAAVAPSLGEFVGGLVFGEPGPHRTVIYLCCAVLAAVLLFRPIPTRPLAISLVAMIPLPFLASLSGWVLREVGRQPWVVYEQLTIDQALSPIGIDKMIVSAVGFLGVLLVLTIVDLVLIARFIRRGPDSTDLGGDAASPKPVSQYI